ncbi:hypothetical protein ACH4T9_18980 [Micromonospora sp. NPDC020750]|uniref:hypothetical protein n=1 Tax=unclassified Micromonospora TaxID=2617518 RepID=UPI003791879C
MEMSRAQLENWLSCVIWRTVTGDGELFDYHSSERSVMFRIGHYLAMGIEAHLGPEWHVDVEYNRQGDQGTPKKAWSLRRSEKDRARSVLPDLIVHRRGLRGRESNLLVVEAKKPDCPGTDADYDRKKLQAYLDEHGYQYAVFLNLGRTPTWEWLSDDQSVLTDVKRPDPFRPA